MLIAAACPPRSTKHKQALLRYMLAERAAAANAAVGLAAPNTPRVCVGRGVNVPATTAQTGPQEDSQSGLTARGLSHGQSAVPDSPDVWGFAISSHFPSLTFYPFTEPRGVCFLFPPPLSS